MNPPVDMTKEILTIRDHEKKIPQEVMKPKIPSPLMTSSTKNIISTEKVLKEKFPRQSVLLMILKFNFEYKFKRKKLKFY